MEEAVDPVKPTSVPPSSGLPEAIMADAPSPFIVTKTMDSAVPPFSRTETRITRDTVFGKQNEELSDIDIEEPPVTAPIKRNFRAKAGAFGSGDKLSSITVVTSPVSKGRVLDSDDDMDEPIALKAASGRASVKKRKVVVDSETEADDVEVLKTVVRRRNSPQNGRMTRASTTLADRLEKVAAAAMKKTIPPVDDQTTTISTKQLKEPSRAAPEKKQAAPASKNLDEGSGYALKRRTSLAAAEVALPVSDDFHLLPMAQSVQAGLTSVLSENPDPTVLRDAFSRLYASNHIAEAASDKVDPGKPAAQIGLHLFLFWLKLFLPPGMLLTCFGLLTYD
jgi:hypothetical protein